MSDPPQQDSTASSPRWHAAVLAAFLAAYLAAVHYATPYAGTIALLFLKRSTEPQTAREIASAVYVALPAIVLIAGIAIRPGRLRDQLVWAAQILARAALAIAVFDLALAPIVGGVFGTHASADVQLLMALTVLCWQLLVFSWPRQLRSPISKSPMKLTPARWLAIAPIVGVMFWSVRSAISAADQAHSIAAGRPYCIATPEAASSGRSYGPICGVEELRGVRLYTWATGYKSTSHWYFHAVLVVGEAAPFEYWNWSIRRMKFERFIEGPRLVVTVKSACEPVESFLSRLS